MGMIGMCKGMNGLWNGINPFPATPLDANTSLAATGLIKSLKLE